MAALSAPIGSRIIIAQAPTIHTTLSSIPFGKSSDVRPAIALQNESNFVQK